MMCRLAPFDFVTLSPNVSLIGVPFDANSSYLRGAAQAPALIREALRGESSNMWSEDGFDLSGPATIDDGRDLVLPEDTSSAFAAIEQAVRETAAGGRRVICLGGDHSITYPIVRGLRDEYANLTILHFDAHPDLYDDFGGPLSHACQFARIMEAGLARRLIQVGIRTMNGHQLEQAARFGVEVITMRNLDRLQGVTFDGPLFVSFDLDVLDPAFAPGVSHYEPGGMSVRDVLRVIQSIRVPLVAADIVEYNPTRDWNGQTAMVSAKVLKEIAAVMLGGSAQRSWV